LPDFDQHEISAYVGRLADQVQRFDTRIADSIRQVPVADLRRAEEELSALEEKLIARLKVETDDRAIIELKRSVEGELNPFRSTMTAPQLAMVEQQLWRRKLLEKYALPRLSMFYLL
jgi:hypothetical protein